MAYGYCVWSFGKWIQSVYHWALSQSQHISHRPIIGQTASSVTLYNMQWSFHFSLMFLLGVILIKKGLIYQRYTHVHGNVCVVRTLICLSFFGFADEHEGTQKKTFTKWINSQLAKVIRSLYIIFLWLSHFLSLSLSSWLIKHLFFKASSSKGSFNSHYKYMTQTTTCIQFYTLCKYNFLLSNQSLLQRHFWQVKVV